MKRRHANALLFVLLALAATQAFAQPPGATKPPKGETAAPGSGQTAGPIKFDREVSQTSVWPGDRFHYHITLTVPQGMKVSLEDFDRKAVNFKPFTLTDTQRVTEELDGGVVRHRFDYLLTNYEVGDRVLEISRVIFHYQKSTAQGKEPNTAEVQVPALPIAVRSTLTQPAKQSWIQEVLDTDVSPSGSWVMTIIMGIAGIVISAIPLMVWVVAQVPQWRARERKMSQKKFLQQCGRSMNVLGKGLDKGLDEIKRQYEALEGVAHQYVQYTWDIPAAGLTGAELSHKLEKRSGTAKQSQVLAKLLDHGQSCRYSSDSKTDWASTFQQDLRELKSTLGAN